MVEKRTSASKRVSKKIPKVEDRELRDYELVLIINPEIAEEKFDATMDNISQFITKQDGLISSTEQWGKRKLAYPIKHFMEGHYVLTRFKLGPASGKELEANLRISEEVLRHLLVKIE